MLGLRFLQAKSKRGSPAKVNTGSKRFDVFTAASGSQFLNTNLWEGQIWPIACLARAMCSWPASSPSFFHPRFLASVPLTRFVGHAAERAGKSRETKDRTGVRPSIMQSSVPPGQKRCAVLQFMPVIRLLTPPDVWLVDSILPIRHVASKHNNKLQWPSHRYCCFRFEKRKCT